MINGGFTEIKQIHDILKPENQLMGCMVGRMAMNNLWEIARVDQEFFPDLDHGEKLTRGEIINLYADFAQKMQDEEVAKGGKISNTILVRPLINLFASEWKGADYRKRINFNATKPEYKDKVR